MTSRLGAGPWLGPSQAVVSCDQLWSAVASCREGVQCPGSTEPRSRQWLPRKTTRVLAVAGVHTRFSHLSPIPG